MIKFTCPHCDKPLRASDAKAGSRVPCPACGRKCTIPDSEDELPPPGDDESDDYTAEPPNRRRGDQERPTRRGSRKSDADEVDHGPRRRKRRRRPTSPEGGAGFSVVDAIHMNYVLQSNIGAGIALVLQILGVVIHSLAGFPLSLVGLVLVFLAIPFWFWGCAAYAKNKGYSELFGLLGLIGLVGLIILVLLPYQESD
jgi:uncharacterized Zn finger protein (UPF0148 family)